MTETPHSTPSSTDPAGLVAVTGATGFVGRHLVRELLSRGWRVRGLTRSADKAAAVLPAEAIKSGALQIVEGDALSPGVLDRLLSGADACVNLIGLIRETTGRQTFHRLHTLTSKAVVEACEAGQVPRLLQMSALGVRADAPTEYQRTKYEGEQAVQLSRLDWTIFRPGLIHGPDGEFMKMVQGWCEGKAMPRVMIPYFTRIAPGWHPPRVPRFEAATVAPVHVQDVAAAFAAALQSPDAIGEIYNLVGAEELKFDDLLRTVRDTLPLGRRGLRVVGVPGSLAACKARVAGLMGMGSLLPFDEGMAIMGQADSVANTDKAKIDLGFDPKPFTESFKGYAASM
ncbi:MAG: hypothetical protein ACI89L_001144 [Phycisphaerales bacterium]|jgi:uncharacterized protein YbjT (DUF2867 family)